MSFRILVIAFFFFAAYAAQAGQDTYVRGAVIWTNEKQTVTECKTGRVYWIRVLASNPHFLFSKKVDELNSAGAENIIAEFRGEISLGMPSLGPRYPVDGTLNVHKIISVESGRCEKRALSPTVRPAIQQGKKA
jgi:hypothetical protein